MDANRTLCSAIAVELLELPHPQVNRFITRVADDSGDSPGYSSITSNSYPMYDSIGYVRFLSKEKVVVVLFTKTDPSLDSPPFVSSPTHSYWPSSCGRWARYTERYHFESI